ncbi:MAG: hypothetical protein EA392_02050 [Cryomorphaceae bacterium]|nr:MAG: hypothetical protein EA392_02050 [Cryomorphaceae bacterium]
MSRDEFLADDHLIPLLVCNQHRIYPDEFQDLKLLRGRTIALVGITYLSGVESNIEKYYLDDTTLFMLTFAEANLMTREYVDTKKYNLRLRNYWQRNV